MYHLSKLTFSILHIAALKFQKNFVPGYTFQFEKCFIQKHGSLSEKLSHNYCKMQMHPVSFSWKEHRVDAQNQGKQVNLIYYCLVSLYQFIRIHCLNRLILNKNKIKYSFHSNFILRSSLNRQNSICTNNTNI